MTTPHIAAKNGEIAEIVLLPGDPLRAQYIAENFLASPRCFNRIRNMLGYTGTYQGRPISVMGTGMGMPSCSIYVHELINFYGVKRLIRVGSAGAMQDALKLRDIVLAQGACSNSGINRDKFKGQDYAPIANFDLLFRAYQIAQRQNLSVQVGNVLSTDSFYDESYEDVGRYMEHGVLAVDMETAALYTLAARFRVQALAMLTVVDHLLDKTQLAAEDLEQSVVAMIKLALETSVTP